MPAAVAVATNPQSNESLDDAPFDALSDATVDLGRLFGAVYELEMPNSWNGNLVLYMHGSHESQRLSVDRPDMREYLIRNHYAWAASSYSTNDLKPGTAADETAALWDMFASRFGRPHHTYVTGVSLGGGGAMISAERYADRYDGVLSFCGIAGQTPHDAYVGDYTLAAALTAGVTQAEWDSATPRDVIEKRIIPALQDDTARSELETLWIRLTGGTRPYDFLGYRRDVETQLMGLGRTYDNRNVRYRLGKHQSLDKGNLTDEEFNAGVIRYAAPTSTQQRDPQQDVTGAFILPVVAVSVTGDGVVPLSEAQQVRRVADAAGAGHLLVQRTVQADGHCELTTAEEQSSFEALVEWVDSGNAPEGEDLLTDDLTKIGAAYTLLPRLGSDADAKGRFLTTRAVFSGRVDVDGQPFDAPFFDAIVDHDGLLADCRYEFASARNGYYRRTVPADDELRGCGAPGASVFFEAFVANGAASGKTLFTSESEPWKPGVANWNAHFSTATPLGVSKPFTRVSGFVFDGDGHEVLTGAVIEAYVGETLCGETSLPPFARLLSDRYQLLLIGSHSRAGCVDRGEVHFKVDGRDVAGTITNDSGGPGEGKLVHLDLRKN